MFCYDDAHVHTRSVPPSRRSLRLSDFDSPWKEALDFYFEPFMAYFFSQAHLEIDWARGYQMLDKELQQVVREAEQGRRVVDKLAKVWRHSGQEEWVLIHVEVQNQEETDFAQRMYVYNYRLFDRYNRTVVSFAILGDDRPTWRPNDFGYALWGCELGFKFPVVKLLDYAADVPALEADPNPFAVVVLAHLKTQETGQDHETRRGWKVRLVKGLYARGLGAKDIRQLYRLIDWMMDLPKPLEGLFLQEIRAFEEEKHMPYVTSAERFGREAGLEEGLQRGRQEGMQEGLREGLLAGIESGLKLKFGTDGLALLPDIRQIDDVQVLRTINRAIEEAASPEALRQIWSTASNERKAQGQ